MPYIKPLTKISNRDIAIAGGKGASLGEMTQAGIPVPAGFVVLSGAFDDFIKVVDPGMKIDRQLHNLDTSAIHSTKKVSSLIQKIIKEAVISKNLSDEILKNFDKLGAEYVAVRSSATSEDSIELAWAGQLESFMNITRDNVVQTVHSCWTSLFSVRAISYRLKNNLEDKNISVAVVIQKMIQSELAGVVFSAHPVSKDRNRIIIEAGEGLGETVVSGSVIPNRYVVRKDSLLILEKATQKGSKRLTKKHIIQLAELVKKVENIYKFPVDVEWALKDDNLYILQSRPITTLDK